MPGLIVSTPEPALRKPWRTALDPGARFEVTLAVGQRLEPWIEALSVSP